MREMDGGLWCFEAPSSLPSLQYSKVNRQVRHAGQSFEHILYMLGSNRRIRQWLGVADA